MAIKARVGRHANGRQCQNWADDQQTITNLLNRIPSRDGGANGALQDRIVSGTCGELLWGAISNFEDLYFPRQRNGFVDPASSMLQRMEQLAARGGSSAPAPTPSAKVFDILRRNLQDESKVQGVWTAGERVKFDSLVTLALRHLDALKAQGIEKLPWPVEMFGRAYVTRFDPIPVISKVGGVWGDSASPRLMFFDADGSAGNDLDKRHLEDPPPLPDMRYGNPVDKSAYITTADHAALLLYAKGDVLRVRRYSSGMIDIENRSFGAYQPRPITNAEKRGFIT